MVYNIVLKDFFLNQRKIAKKIRCRSIKANQQKRIGRTPILFAVYLPYEMGNLCLLW